MIEYNKNNSLHKDNYYYNKLKKLYWKTVLQRFITNKVHLINYFQHNAEINHLLSAGTNRIKTHDINKPLITPRYGMLIVLVVLIRVVRNRAYLTQCKNRSSFMKESNTIKKNYN